MKRLFPGERRHPAVGSAVLHPADILAALKAVVEEKKKIFKTGIFVPDAFTVHLAVNDIEALDPFLDSLSAELDQELRHHIRKKGYRLNAARPCVQLRQRLVLRSGQIEVDAAFSPMAQSSPSRRAPAVRLAIDGCRDSVELSAGSWVLGRDAVADVPLPQEDMLISKKHCALSIDDRQITLRDLGSTNGTLVNGRRIEDEQGLADGDRLLVGATEIEVRIGTYETGSG